MAENRTRIIGSAIAGTGVAALIVAGMAFGMPDLGSSSDPALADSARARAQLLARTATTPSQVGQSSDAAQVKAGDLELPAQAADPIAEAAAVTAAAAAPVANPAAAPLAIPAAAPVAIPAAAQEPLSQASPAGYEEEEDDEDEKAGYAAGEEEDEDEEYEEEYEEGDDD